MQIKNTDKLKCYNLSKMVLLLKITNGKRLTQSIIRYVSSYSSLSQYKTID